MFSDFIYEKYHTHEAKLLYAR